LCVNGQGELVGNTSAETEHVFAGAHNMGSWSSHQQTTQQGAFNFRASRNLSRASLLETNQAMAVSGTTLMLVLFNTNIFHFAQHSMMGFAYRLWREHGLLEDGMDFNLGSESKTVAVEWAYDRAYLHAAGTPTNPQGKFSPWIHGLSELIAGRETTVITQSTPSICFENVVVPATHGSIFWNQKVARSFRRASFARFQLPLLIMNEAGYLERESEEARVNAVSIVYVQREKGSGRRIVNSNAVEEILVSTANAHQLNCFAAELSAMPFKEQMVLMAAAHITVMAHGAAVANLMFMRSGSYVVYLLPPKIQVGGHWLIAMLYAIVHTTS
jgi:hypothetical protein